MKWLVSVFMMLMASQVVADKALATGYDKSPWSETWKTYDWCLSSSFHGGEECNTGERVGSCMYKAARCLYAAEKKDGDKLAKLYRELVGGLHIGDRKAIQRLRISQRAWLKYHKAQCDIRKNHTPYWDPDARLNRFEHARCQLLSTKRRLWELLDEYVHHSDDWHNQK